MSQFIESIKIENGTASLLHLHQQRMNHTFAHFGKENKINLNMLFTMLNCPKEGLHKWRIVYDLEQQWEQQITPYQFAKIETFELIENPEIDYHFKFLDRTALDSMKRNSLAQEIIITKNGHITDSSFSNLLFLKNGVWHTPKTYLLNGVQRQNLLQLGLIKETNIHIDNIKEFSHFQIINAMNEINSSSIYPIQKIINLF